jgi:hypothetical protein
MNAQCIAATALLADGNSGVGGSSDEASNSSVSTNDANESAKIAMLKLCTNCHRMNSRAERAPDDSHEMYTRDRHENHSGFGGAHQKVTAPIDPRPVPQFPGVTGLGLGMRRAAGLLLPRAALRAIRPPSCLLHVRSHVPSRTR